MTIKERQEEGMRLAAALKLGRLTKAQYNAKMAKLWGY